MEKLIKSKKGNKIHIKKSHLGKFTDYCGGEVTDKCILKAKQSSDPSVRKRATFAENARKWKHVNGGLLKLVPKHSLGSFFKNLYEGADEWVKDKSTKLRKNKEGLYLDADGNVVDSAEKALLIEGKGITDRIKEGKEFYNNNKDSFTAAGAALTSAVSTAKAKNLENKVKGLLNDLNSLLTSKTAALNINNTINKQLEILDNAFLPGSYNATNIDFSNVHTDSPTKIAGGGYDKVLSANETYLNGQLSKELKKLTGLLETAKKDKENAATAYSNILKNKEAKAQAELDKIKVAEAAELQKQADKKLLDAADLLTEMIRNISNLGNAIWESVHPSLNALGVDENGNENELTVTPENNNENTEIEYRYTGTSQPTEEDSENALILTADVPAGQQISNGAPAGDQTQNLNNGLASLTTVPGQVDLTDPLNLKNKQALIQEDGGSINPKALQLIKRLRRHE